MNYKFLLLAMPCALSLVPFAASAGIRVGNLSRNNAQAYQQVNELRNGLATQAAVTVNPKPATAPIPVSDSQMENSIRSGDANSAENMAKLEKCSMIYPDGEFVWGVPTLGRGVGGAPTCTAVVEMRAIGAGPNGTDAILARGNLAVGDMLDCNIFKFPEASYLPAAGEVAFPEDAAPTMDDVIAVMNEEQKQNAGIKIAAGVILGGLGGNITGENAPGSDSLLGGGKDKVKNTVVGALGGAALMAGNAYTGKVAGDMILSTGVNAAAGAVVGNVVASGDSILRIEPCKVDGRDTHCLWGYYDEVGELEQGDVSYVSSKNPNDFKLCHSDGRCEYAKLNVNNAYIVGGYADKDGFKQKNRSTGEDMNIETLFREDPGFSTATEKFCFKNSKMEPYTSVSDCTDMWVKLDGVVQKITKRTPAMVADISDKTFGWKKSDWSDLSKNIGLKMVYGRSGSGVATNLTANGVLRLKDISFTPLYQDSEDGGMIDLNNGARMQATLTGAGVGGAMGAFSAYQGAQKEIEERWLLAQEEYRGQLSKFYCATGTRFLSSYNSTFEIMDISAE